MRPNMRPHTKAPYNSTLATAYALVRRSRAPGNSREAHGVQPAWEEFLYNRNDRPAEMPDQGRWVSDPVKQLEKRCSVFDERKKYRMTATRCVMAIFSLVGLLAGLAIQTPLVQAAENLSSIARGGRLYDNWYVEVRDRAPMTTHPAYPKNGYFARDPEATWRCKECHGWDYLGDKGAYRRGPHYTGIKGIRGMSGAPQERIVEILKDDSHRYGDLLDERDLRDLANFVADGLVDMRDYIDEASGEVKADNTKGAAYFDSICGNCHGSDGQTFKEIPPLGRIAIVDPWQSMHKILNGHPGENMPALRAFDNEIVVQILAHTQMLPTHDMITSLVRGGRLYDNWYIETDTLPPRYKHPAYPSDKQFANDYPTTWRCKECHGWDYKGKDGDYGQGQHNTGIKGIYAMAGEDPARIEKVLRDDFHAYEGKLKDKDFADLANFISRGLVNMDRHINRDTKAAKGSRYARESFFNTICASCHGRSGTKITTMVPLGRITNTSPWNALHKIMHGHPGEEMPALRVLLEMGPLVDILAYAQTLQRSR